MTAHMTLLGIETASESCSVALMVNGDVLERYRHAPRRHAELLLPWVDELLAEADIGLGSLDAIAYSRGPGSFTSLRIGIGVVQGLAWATNRPVVPVSSLAATAQSAVEAGVRSVLVALDARMQEVFTAQFSLSVDDIMLPLGEEKVCAPEDVRLEGGGAVLGVGVGFERYPVLGERAGQLVGIEASIWPKASAVLALAQHWLHGNEPLPVEHAQPVYLRNKVARKSGQ